jgi:hypothetical protein
MPKELTNKKKTSAIGGVHRASFIQDNPYPENEAAASCSLSNILSSAWIPSVCSVASGAAERQLSVTDSQELLRQYDNAKSRAVHKVASPEVERCLTAGSLRHRHHAISAVAGGTEVHGTIPV